jgi:hypothetical protein
MKLYETLRYSTLRYFTLLYSTLLYATLRYSTLLYATLRYSTLLYATLRYSTLLYATLLYATHATIVSTDNLYEELLPLWNTTMDPQSWFYHKLLQIQRLRAPNVC